MHFATFVWRCQYFTTESGENERVGGDGENEWGFHVPMFMNNKYKNRRQQPHWASIYINEHTYIMISVAVLVSQHQSNVLLLIILTILSGIGFSWQLCSRSIRSQRIWILYVYLFICLETLIHMCYMDMVVKCIGDAQLKNSTIPPICAPILFHSALCSTSDHFHVHLFSFPLC